jgi:hypothetical protein
MKRFDRFFGQCAIVSIAGRAATCRFFRKQHCTHAQVLLHAHFVLKAILCLFTDLKILRHWLYHGVCHLSSLYARSSASAEQKLVVVLFASVALVPTFKCFCRINSVPAAALCRTKPKARFGRPFQKP